MKRAVLVMALMTGGLLAIPVAPARASWVGSNCHVNNFNDGHVRRSDARAYGVVAIGEGYEWGGGCWNDDNRDDTPGQPDSGGEGPDCSGLVFKSWELKATPGRSGAEWWDRYQNIHGPYTSYSFHAPIQSWPFYRLANKYYSTTMYMDAFAKGGHAALIYSESQPQDGTDSILEALGDSYGTNVWIESYRHESEYVAVRREGWTPDCWPNCHLGEDQAVVLR